MVNIRPHGGAADGATDGAAQPSPECRPKPLEIGLGGRSRAGRSRIGPGTLSILGAGPGSVPSPLREAVPSPLSYLHSPASQTQDTRLLSREAISILSVKRVLSAWLHLLLKLTLTFDELQSSLLEWMSVVLAVT